MMNYIKGIIIGLFGLTLSNNIHAQSNASNGIDSVIIEGLLVQVIYEHPVESIESYDEKIVTIDTESSLLFINEKHLSKKRLINILKDIQSYELNRNKMFLMWDYDAEAFYLALRFQIKMQELRSLNGH